MSIRKIKVPDQIISSDREMIEADKVTDPKLSNIWKRVELGNVTVSRGRNEIRYEERFNLLTVYFAW